MVFHLLLLSRVTERGSLALHSMPSQKGSCDAALLSVPFLFDRDDDFSGSHGSASDFDLNASCLLTLLRGSQLKCSPLN